jgi:ABC-type transporter Mla subunit MlaD
VDDALPALIDVAAVIDRTLSALSDVPFGPDYDPAEPFDESLRSIQRELDGLPEALRAQADLVRQASGSLAEVRTGTTSIADQLDELERSLRDADRLMDGYADTTARARTVVERRQRELDGDLRSARLLVVALGLTVAAANVAPIGLGWVLDHPSSGAV